MNQRQMEKKMNRKWMIGLFLLMFALMLAPDRSQAQDMKIGYVEPRAILDRMPEMRAVEQRMQNFVERKRQELTDQEGELQQELEAFQQKIGVISDNAR
ncbi:MAG: OmpH family outer membrane protein, partial [Bacteroidota bacterium]